MGLFDFLKKKRLSPENQALIDSIDSSLKQIAETPPQTLSNEEYQKMRQSEAEWLERHYDLNTVKGVNLIPAKKGLRCPTTSGVTGQLYYYLRRKAYDYEKEGKIELAIACMSKSSELAILDYESGIQKEELYPLVRMLARNGRIEEAAAEKAFVDKLCREQREKLDKEMVHQAFEEAAYFGTDLVIMSVLGAACPDCAKYQGRVYSLSGKNKKFPPLPSVIAETGRACDNCCHLLHSYIDGVNDPQLDYTLSVHPLQNKRYGRNIVAFSNRPFEDDRTSEAKAKALVALQEHRERAEHSRILEDRMIELEAEKGRTAHDYKWLQHHFPDRCPKSVSGYRRMKTQNTKNFQILKQLAADLGREI